MHAQLLHLGIKVVGDGEFDIPQRQIRRESAVCAGLILCQRVDECRLRSHFVSDFGVAGDRHVGQDGDWLPGRRGLRGELERRCLAAVPVQREAEPVESREGDRRNPVVAQILLEQIVQVDHAAGLSGLETPVARALVECADRNADLGRIRQQKRVRGDESGVRALLPRDPEADVLQFEEILVEETEGPVDVQIQRDGQVVGGRGVSEGELIDGGRGGQAELIAGGQEGAEEVLQRNGSLGERALQGETGIGD